MFVDVDYKVENTGTSSLSRYEVYFKIYTPDTTFYEEIKGDSLYNGEQSIGSFHKYIRKFSADSVAISGVYAPNS